MSVLGGVQSTGGFLSASEVFGALEDINSALGRYQYCYGASPISNALIISPTQIMISPMH